MVSIQPEPQDNTRVNQQPQLKIERKETVKTRKLDEEIAKQYRKPKGEMLKQAKPSEEDLKKLEQRKIETHNKAQETKGKQKPSHGI